MIVCLFDNKRLVSSKCVAQRQTDSHFKMMKELRDTVRKKKPEIWSDKWIFYRDNAPANNGLGVREILATKSIQQTGYQPPSSDIAHCKFWQYPKLKNALKRKRFVNIPDIQQHVSTFFYFYKTSGLWRS